MIAYKVVINVNGNRMSAVMGITEGGIVYHEDKPNVPKLTSYPLFCFKTRDQARKFRLKEQTGRFYGWSYEIWKVKIKPSIVDPRNILPPQLSVPEGTITADEVILKELI